MSLTVSPLAPAGKPHLPALAGVRLAVIEAGLRYHGRPDLLLVALPTGSAVAGVFTKSTTAGAPVVWCRDHLAGGVARGLVVNAGNANVFNGAAGQRRGRDVGDGGGTGARLRAGGSVPGLDRGDRRAARRRGHRRRLNPRRR